MLFQKQKIKVSCSKKPWNLWVKQNINMQSFNMLICSVNLQGIKRSISQKKKIMGTFYFLTAFIYLFMNLLFSKCLLYFFFSASYIPLWQRDRNCYISWVKCRVKGRSYNEKGNFTVTSDLYGDITFELRLEWYY